MKQPTADIIVIVQCRVCQGGYEARKGSIAADERICTPCWEYQDIANGGCFDSRNPNCDGLHQA